MACPNYDILIIYGSETGNSEEYAKQIYQKLIHHNFNCQIYQGDSFTDWKLFTRAKFIIFIVSTAGQGSEPKNFQIFWKYLLQTSLPKSTWLSEVQTAVLGLGDSTYKRYNFCAKRLYRRLSQLGCTHVVPLGLSNDQDEHGSATVALPWISNVFQILLNKFKIEMIYEEPSHAPSYSVIPYNNRNDKNVSLQKCQLGSIQMYLLENSIITSPDHFQQVNHIKFSLSQSLSYSPGDILVVYPKNEDQLINLMKSLFNHINETELVSIQSFNEQFSTLLVNFQWLCEWYFDLNAIPRRYFFNHLSQYSTNDVEKNKLVELYLPENIDSFYSYCSRPRRNYYESLRDFPKSVKCLNLSCLLELIPRMKPREYSICSSLSHESKLDIVVALVRYQTVIVQPRHGLCSNYLCNLRSGESVSAQLKPSTLIFPDKNTQLIMIATGTGCAAYRAYIQSLPYDTSAPTHLVFLGFRNREKDFLFGNDWQLFQQNKHIKLFLAFSRDQSEKIYVQNKLIENGKLLWDSIQKGAYIYVSGNAKRMPDNIYEAFLGIAKFHGSMSLESAKLYLNSLEKLNRYQTETY